MGWVYQDSSAFGTGKYRFKKGKAVLIYIIIVNTKTSASVKVLNSGLGPFKDETAEMVLFRCASIS